MINSKKIIIFTNEFPPFIGGVGKIAYELAKLYSNICKTTIIVKKQRKLNIIDNVDFKIVSVLPKIWFFSYAFFYFRNKNLFDEADLIYLNEAAPTITAGMFFEEKHLKKCVIIAHGLEVEGVLNSNRILHKIFKIKKSYIKAVEKSKKLITLSLAMKNKLIPNLKKYEHKIYAFKQMFEYRLSFKYKIIFMILFLLPISSYEFLQNIRNSLKKNY